jgi:hypothetical protein
MPIASWVTATTFEHVEHIVNFSSNFSAPAKSAERQPAKVQHWRLSSESHQWEAAQVPAQSSRQDAQQKSCLDLKKNPDGLSLEDSHQ